MIKNEKGKKKNLASGRWARQSQMDLQFAVAARYLSLEAAALFLDPFPAHVVLFLPFAGS